LSIEVGSADNDALRIDQSLAPIGAATTISGGAGRQSFELDATPVSGTLAINTNGVTDEIKIVGDASGFGGIREPVQVNNHSGSATLDLINDDGDASPRNYSLSDSAFLGGGAGAAINYSGVGSIDLIASATAATSTITVQPGLSATFAIHGNSAQTPPAANDALIVNVNGTTGASLTSQSGTSGLSGAYTFTNRLPITFDRMGTANPQIGSVAGTVYNGQSAAGIASAVVFADLNQNGTLDSGEPSVVTDASGEYVLGDLSPGTDRIVETPPAALAPQNLPVDFSDVSIVAGAAITEINFPDVPAPAALGPDLTASFVGAVPVAVLDGETGRIKLKIINGGLQKVTGLPQIDLFAAPGSDLSPGLTPFQTLAAGRINLRPHAARTVSLSIHYPTGIANGNYFLLATIDPTNVIAETNEANNTASSPLAISIATPFVDLTAALGHLPRGLSAKRAAAVPVIVGNIGNSLATGSITVSIFASTDQTFDGADPLLKKLSGQRISIKQGKLQTLHLRVTNSQGIPSGTYFLIAIVNSDQAFLESNAGNDMTVSAIGIEIG
jgi:hypothetical protein